MLWSQYKSATIRHSKFLHKQITRIPNIANRNSNFLTLQTSEFQKKNPTGIFGIKNWIGIPLTMEVPEIGTTNQNSQPSANDFHRCALNSSGSTLSTAWVYSSVLLSLGLYSSCKNSVRYCIMNPFHIYYFGGIFFQGLWYTLSEVSPRASCARFLWSV